MNFRVSQLTGLKYHYEVKETGLPFDLAFIHGNLASRRWWYPVCEHFPKRNQTTGKGRVFLLEFLGCGLSQAPRSQADVDMRQFAREFNEILKTEKFYGGVVGHSTGGLIAGLMISYAPEIFKGGFALDPVGVNGVTFDESMTKAFEAMKTDKALTATVIGSTIKDVDVNHPFFTDVIVEDAYLAVQQVGDLVLRALAGFNAEAEFSKIEKPYWVVHGQEDTLLPIEDSKKMAQLTKKGHFLEVPGAGHCLNYENPKKLAELLLEWQNFIA